MVLTHKTYQIAEGVDLFFTDTGAPSNSNDYTTLVIIHGMGFPGAWFKPLQSQSQALVSSNLRILALNRRDYPGSTPFSDSELEALRGEDDGLTQKFHDNLGRHLWLFLRKFIDEEVVPPIATDDSGGKKKRTGGIVVMGWSYGAAFAIAAFANPEVVGDAYELLERYVKGLLVYDTSHTTLGYPTPSNLDGKNLYTPWSDPNAENSHQVFEKLVPWVCSRYQYEYAAREVDDRDDFIPTPTLESLKKTGLLDRTEDCFTDSWSEGELERLTEKEATFPERSDMALLARQTIFENATRKVLFDEYVAKTFFPNLSITYLYAPHSIWICVLGYTETRRRYEELANLGRAIRPIEFVELKGADHFVHYTDPQGFLRIIGEIV
ncbi:hypothetical protein PQX77_001315 [Marasmius sp. AFHP31]|nr:hypothetical protein PQX77_001315 [Marasmius sp. AFHP31]